MRGREMRLTEQHQDDRLRMAFANFLNFVGSMPITRADAPEIFPRHAIQAVNGFAMVSAASQQLKNRFPIVTPLGIEPDSPAKLIRIDFTAPPLIQDALVASENRFQAEDNRTVARLDTLFKKFGGEVLRVGQGVVVAYEENICALNGGVQVC
jgi:hypothetical protein